MNVKEALGYSHEKTMDSSYALICGLMQEYAYLCHERNQILQRDEEDTEAYEWIEMVDFKSGELKRYKKYKQADHLL